MPSSAWPTSRGRCSTRRCTTHSPRSWGDAAHWCSWTRAAPRPEPPLLISVTGATGFVGRHVAATLVARGHRVRVLARDPARARFLSDLNVEIVAGALADRPALDPLASGADALTHLFGIILAQGAQTSAAAHGAALAFALAAERPDGVGVFELGGPQVLNYEELLLTIGRASRHSRPLAHVPLGLVRAAAGVFDVLGATAPLTSDQVQMLVEGSATPANAIESVFGIEPVAFEDGLKRFL